MSRLQNSDPCRYRWGEKSRRPPLIQELPSRTSQKQPAPAKTQSCSRVILHAQGPFEPAHRFNSRIFEEHIHSLTPEDRATDGAARRTDRSFIHPRGRTFGCSTSSPSRSGGNRRGPAWRCGQRRRSASCGTRRNGRVRRNTHSFSGGKVTIIVTFPPERMCDAITHPIRLVFTPSETYLGTFVRSAIRSTSKPSLVRYHSSKEEAHARTVGNSPPTRSTAAS